MIINQSISKSIKSINRKPSYDTRYDDVVITLEDDSSILIQGDFSLTSLQPNVAL